MILDFDTHGARGEVRAAPLLQGDCGGFRTPSRIRRCDQVWYPRYLRGLARCRPLYRMVGLGSSSGTQVENLVEDQAHHSCVIWLRHACPARIAGLVGTLWAMIGSDGLGRRDPVRQRVEARQHEADGE